MEKHQRNARRIEAAILELQGLFIKVGQLISIMTNFLPDEFRAGARRAAGSGAAAPVHATSRRASARSSAGADRASCSPSSPSGRSPRRRSARCTARACTTGEKVAVKVQYPDIEEIVAHRSARAAAHLRGRAAGSCPTQGLDTIYREIREMVLAELDFRAEAGERAPHRRQLRRAHRTSPSRASSSELIDRARADHRTGWTASRSPTSARLDAAGVDRRAPRRARRRGLLPADLHRRPLSRRSAPGEPAGPPPGRPGRRADHRVPRLRRGRRGLAGDARGHDRSSSRARSTATPRASSPR